MLLLLRRLHLGNRKKKHDTLEQRSKLIFVFGGTQSSLVMDGFEWKFCSFSLCFRNCFIVYSVDLNANKTEISSKWDKTVIEPYRIAIINRKWRTYVPPANNKHNISIIFIRHAIAQTARDVCSDWYWGERNKKKTQQ